MASMDVVCASACSNKQECTKAGPWFNCGRTMCIKAALHCGYCIECGEKTAVTIFVQLALRCGRN